MPLEGYTPQTREIEVPGFSPLRLRGLSLSDVSFLVRIHRADLDTMFAKMQAKSESDGPPEMGMVHLVTVLFETAPMLASAVIALAADEPNEIEVVNRLPVSVQIEAIEAVGELTFAGEGGSKKVVEAVTRMIGGVRSLVSPRPPLLDRI